MRAIIKLTPSNYKLNEQTISLHTSFGADITVPVDKVSAQSDTILVPVEYFREKNLLPSDVVDGYCGITE